MFGGYELSESCPVLSLAQLTPEVLEATLGEEVSIRTKAGRTTPLVNLRIVDSELRDQAHDGVATGEVVVRAPWLNQGYLNDPVSSEVLWAGGFMHTGDIGTIDPQGYLLITDRIRT